MRRRGDTSSFKVGSSAVENGMSIGSAISKRIDTDAPQAIGRPWCQLCCDLELPFLELYLRVSFLEVDAGWDQASFENKNGFNNGSDTGSCFEMANLDAVSRQSRRKVNGHTFDFTEPMRSLFSDVCVAAIVLASASVSCTSPACVPVP